jgi:hypothetical protein
LDADSVTADIVAASADHLITFCPEEGVLQRNLKMIFGLREYQRRRTEKIKWLNFMYVAVSSLVNSAPNASDESRQKLHDKYNRLFNDINRFEPSADGDNGIIASIERQHAGMIDTYNIMFN